MATNKNRPHRMELSVGQLLMWTGTTWHLYARDGSKSGSLNLYVNCNGTARVNREHEVFYQGDDMEMAVRIFNEKTSL